MDNDDLFNFLVATDTLDDFLGYHYPTKNETEDEELERIEIDSDEDINEID